MSRFEIEDIISQDKRGIVFCAHDSQRGHTVALRRFFPFGQDGGGLSEEESAAFVMAAQRIEGVRHDSLRSVIAGSVDPIDGMPFIVAEWIDGAPLDGVLNGEKLEAVQVIELLRLALEVSLKLSEALGEESVWVETEVDSIFVGSEESCRGYVFWLSPFKWLGADFGSRKLAAIVELGESLTGWKGKLIGDNAGNGLGWWLKWMRNNPDARLAEALAALASRTMDGEAPPPPQPASAAVAPAPAVIVKPPSSSAPVMMAVGAFLLLAVVGLGVYRKMGKGPPAPPLAETSAATEPDTVAAGPKPAPRQPARSDEGMSVAEATALAAKLAKEKEIERMAAKVPPVKAPSAPLEFMPGDGDRFGELKSNSPAILTGVVLKVFTSQTGKSLYFEFSEPPVATEIKAVAHKSKYPDDFTPGAYSDLIGKKVRFNGKVFREPNGKQYVKIISRQQFTVVE
jgi:hypothetical protein